MRWHHGSDCKAGANPRAHAPCRRLPSPSLPRCPPCLRLPRRTAPRVEWGPKLGRAAQHAASLLLQPQLCWVRAGDRGLQPALPRPPVPSATPIAQISGTSTAPGHQPSPVWQHRRHLQLL